MNGEFFKGDVKDVCAELKAEMERCGKIGVVQWLRLRKLEQLESEQLGINVNIIRNDRNKLKK